MFFASLCGQCKQECHNIHNLCSHKPPKQPPVAPAASQGRQGSQEEERSMSAMKQPLCEKEKKSFVSPLLGCCSYRDPTNSCKWCPYFFPMSVCGTCFIVGRVVSKLEDEDETCCEMGPKGIGCCILSNVLMGPPGYMCVGCCLRSQVVDKFNVDDDGSCILNTICYPCSYFQMFVSLSEWQSNNTASTGTQHLK